MLSHVSGGIKCSDRQYKWEGREASGAQMKQMLMLVFGGKHQQRKTTQLYLHPLKFTPFHSSLALSVQQHEHILIFHSLCILMSFSSFSSVFSPCLKCSLITFSGPDFHTNYASFRLPAARLTLVLLITI